MTKLELTSAKASRIAVFGAAGHTGRFVVSELLRRGIAVVAIGRDEEKLARLADTHPGIQSRLAHVDDPSSLDRALEGVAIVVNCAGPFLDTAEPLILAALRARVHYVDVSAEQKVTLAAFEKYSEAARSAGVVILPSMGFFGGLGDLLASATMCGWGSADEINLAVAMDSWKPTQGTRLTGERNPGKRSVFSAGRLIPIAEVTPKRDWNFKSQFGSQEVVAFPLTETIVISRHLHSPEIHAYINRRAIDDIHNPDTPAPSVAENKGHSGQRFRMEVVVRSGYETRTSSVEGFDIYAVTAPLIGEAVMRLIKDKTSKAGTIAPGELFNAHEFLESLSPEYLLYTGSNQPVAR